MIPKCKDVKNKVIQIHKTMQTNAGETYYAGEYLVCRKMTKDGQMQLFRPGKGINCQYNDEFKIIGTKQDIFGV